MRGLCPRAPGIYRFRARMWLALGRLAPPPHSGRWVGAPVASLRCRTLRPGEPSITNPSARESLACPRRYTLNWTGTKYRSGHQHHGHRESQTRARLAQSKNGILPHLTWKHLMIVQGPSAGNRRRPYPAGRAIATMSGEGRRYRLTVRTEPSQGSNTGSIPVSATMFS